MLMNVNTWQGGLNVSSLSIYISILFIDRLTGTGQPEGENCCRLPGCLPEHDLQC